jgi:hypothetical protein
MDVVTAKNFAIVYDKLGLHNSHLPDVVAIAKLFLIEDQNLLWYISDTTSTFVGRQCVVFENVRMNFVVEEKDDHEKTITFFGIDDDIMLEIDINIHEHTSYVDGIYPTTRYFNIHGIYSGMGSFLLRLVDTVNNYFHIRESKLIDVSSRKMCNGSVDVPMMYLFLLSNGNSWYMDHGFLPRDSGHSTSLLHVATIRAKSLQNFYGKTGARAIVKDSGVAMNPEDITEFISNMQVGHFFEIMRDNLFNDVQLTCDSVNSIIQKTLDRAKKLRYNIELYNFTKRYDIIEEHIPSRVQRTNTKFLPLY